MLKGKKRKDIMKETERFTLVGADEDALKITIITDKYNGKEYMVVRNDPNKIVIVPMKD